MTLPLDGLTTGDKESLLDIVIVKIKAILDRLPFDLEVTYIADAARLAHHGFLGSL